MNRTRRQLLVALGASLLAWPLPSRAQKPVRVWRVGFLGGGRRPTTPDMDIFGGLARGLRDLGYVEGTNLVIEWRFAEGVYERLPSLAADLLKVPVDVIVADGNPATKAAQGAGGTTPIVFASNDPVGSGLVSNLSRPGGRSTGVSLFAIEGGIGAKQLELLLTFAPGTRTVAVLSNPGNPTALPIVDGIRAAAPAAKVEVLSLHATSAAEIENAFVEMKKRRAGALLWVRDSFLNSQRCQIAELASAHHLPAIGGVRTFTVCGGLMSYGSNGAENMRRIASYVDKILKGENPGILPVEQASKLELLINRKTAKALGLTIPPELLLLADQVIE